MSRRLTRKGRATRDRIVQAASERMARDGVGGASVDAILADAGAGKSQFYHYFRDKADLLAAVLRRRMAEALPGGTDGPHSLDSWTSIEAWFARIRRRDVTQGYGTIDPLGAFVLDLLQVEGPRNPFVVRAVTLRSRLLRRGLRRMQARGTLRSDADPAALASFAAAAIQGALILAAAERSLDPLSETLDQTFLHLRASAREPVRPPEG